MLAEGVSPTSSWSTAPRADAGAAPPEFAASLGTPLTEGLITVHNALVGTGLRDRVRIGADGGVAAGSDIVKRLAQGADYERGRRDDVRTRLSPVPALPHQHLPGRGRDPGPAPGARPGRGRRVGARAPLPAGHGPQRKRIMAAMGVRDPAELDRISCCGVGPGKFVR